MASKLAVIVVALAVFMRRLLDPGNVSPAVRFCMPAIPVMLVLLLLAGCSGDDKALEEARADRDYYSEQLATSQQALNDARADRDYYSEQLVAFQQALKDARADRDYYSEQLVASQQALEEARTQSDARYEQGYSAGLALGRTQSTQVSYDQGYATGLLQGRADGLNGLTTNADASGGSAYKAVALELAVAATPTTTTDRALMPSATSAPALRSQTVTVTLLSKLYFDYFVEQLTDVLVAGELENLYHYEGDEGDKEIRQNTTLPEGLHCYNLHILWKNHDALEDGDDSNGHIYVEGGEEFHLVRTDGKDWRLEESNEKSIAVFDWLREGETSRVVHIKVPDQDDVIFSLDKNRPFDADEILLPTEGALEYEIVTEVSSEASPKPIISESPAPGSLSAASGALYQIAGSGQSIGLQPSSYCKGTQEE